MGGRPVGTRSKLKMMCWVLCVCVCVCVCGSHINPAIAQVVINSLCGYLCVLVHTELTLTFLYC